MALGSVFRTTVSTTDPTSGHPGVQPPANTAAPSDFITVQSLANFAVMTGAITAAWGVLAVLLVFSTAAGSRLCCVWRLV